MPGEPSEEFVERFSKKKKKKKPETKEVIKQAFTGYEREGGLWEKIKKLMGKKNEPRKMGNPHY
jgi:hypothetical protein